jgi:hypothetical protein
MKITDIFETTTSGSVATVAKPMGKAQSRNGVGKGIYPGVKGGNLLTGKPSTKKFANSVKESKQIEEAHLEEDDLIIVPGQGRSRKTGLIKHGESRLDHEVEMAKSDLFSAAKNAKKVYEMIQDVSEEEGLEGWVQEKIIKANDYLNTIREYLEGKQLQEMTGGVIAAGGVGESSQRGDTLVTDSLRIMKGPEVNDAIRALKTVLGDREYNSRRGFYNFYIKQMLNMYGKQGVSEESTTNEGSNQTPTHRSMRDMSNGKMSLPSGSEFRQVQGSNKLFVHLVDGSPKEIYRINMKMLEPLNNRNTKG